MTEALRSQQAFQHGEVFSLGQPADLMFLLSILLRAVFQYWTCKLAFAQKQRAVYAGNTCCAVTV